MYFAIGVEPTNDTALTPGCARSASTASLSPCTTLNTPSGRPASLQQLGHAQRQRRIALGGLQHERVAAGERHREHPHRHHRREIERRDAGAHADRLAQRVAVDVGADVLAELALQQMRNAGGELDHLDAARDRALGVGERLAVLLRDDLREVLLVRLHQLAKAHQHARAAQRRRRAPGGQRRRRGLHRRVDVGRVAERHVADHLAGGGIGDFAVARRARGHRASADPQRQPFECGQVHLASSSAAFTRVAVDGRARLRGLQPTVSGAAPSGVNGSFYAVTGRRFPASRT